jgi:hypothetical protein
MPILKMTISLDINVDYYENKTGKTDQQIIDEVLLCTVEERNILAMEARIAALKLLEGDSVEDIINV